MPNKRLWTGAGLALALTILFTASQVSATRDAPYLMTFDHHLLRADLIADLVVTNRTVSMVGGVPLQQVTATVNDIWHSRWGSPTSISFNTSAQFPHLDEGGRHVVLLSGGPWNRSPFTQREHSLFRVDENGNQLTCASGTGLFGVLNDGFYCSHPDIVTSANRITIQEMKARVLCARARAAARYPGLESELSSSPRPLQLAPSTTPVSPPR